MKTLLAFLALASTAFAGPVTLAWDHDQLPGEVYEVKSATTTFPTTDKKEQTITLAPGSHTLTVSTINSAGLRSEPSAPLTVIVPSGPANLRVKLP